MPRNASWIAYGLCGVSLLALSGSLLKGLTPFGSATTPDSVAYLDMASNIRNGDGWNATDMSLDAIQQHRTVENRNWPPLYPAVLALFVEHPRDVQGVARLSGILLVLSTALAFLIVARRAHWLLALGAAIAMALCIPMVTVFSYAWSETLFIPLLLLAALASMEYLEAPAASTGRRLCWAVTLTLALIAIVFTRYIGLASALLLPLTFLLSRRDRLDRILFAACIPAYGAPVAWLLLGNLRASGSFSGTGRAPSEMTLGQNLWHLSEAFGAAFPVSPVVLLLTAAVAVALALVIARFALRRAAPTRSPSPASAILACSAAIYLVALTALRSTSRFDEIDVRLIAPALPLLLLAACLGASRLTPGKRGTSAIWAVGLFLLGSLAAEGYRQFRASSASWVAHGSPELPLRRYYLYRNYTPDPLARNVYASLVGPDGILVADRALEWRFLTGVRTAQLPSEVDERVVATLRGLPLGSAVLLQKSTQAPVLQRLKAGQDYWEKVEIGSFIGVRLCDRSSAPGPCRPR